MRYLELVYPYLFSLLDIVHQLSKRDALKLHKETLQAEYDEWQQELKEGTEKVKLKRHFLYKEHNHNNYLSIGEGGEGDSDTSRTCGMSGTDAAACSEDNIR